MEIKYTKEKIILEKELNNLDKFILDFVLVLNELNIKYVLVSGYVSILFGRSRSSEDIDIIIERLERNKFRELWNKLYKKFECLNTENSDDAYNNYLISGSAIRFSEKNNFIPNIEVKFPKIELDFWTLKQRKEVILNKNKLFISPLELQIPFKLFLGKEGNEKDIEDAKYLYELFKDKLDLNLLQEFNRKLKIEEVFNKYLK
jgi:hypothetical protein